MYQAIIAKLVNVRKHSNADALQLANPCGMQVIVGLDNKEGELGVFFASDGVLSEEMLRENNLYLATRTKDANGKLVIEPQPLNKDPSKSGFFNLNGRVRAQNFRGEKSHGYWTDLSSLEWTGVNTSSLKEGFTFTHLSGKEICRKYINPATKRASLRKGSKKGTVSCPLFKQHFDTKQLQYEISKIPKDSILFISSKCHGTSSRTGMLPVKQPLTSYQNWWNRYFYWTGRIYKPAYEYQLITGTRRVVLNPNDTSERGYYSGNTFRYDIHSNLKEKNIPQNWTIYYEIAGFTETGSPIMNSHSVNKIQDKKFRKQVEKIYGKEMVYSYGCKKDNGNPAERYRVLVYRFTTTTENGLAYDFSWPQVKDICSMLGLETVPELHPPVVYDGDREKLLELVDSFLDKPEGLDPSHIREGVCVRIETPAGKTYILKSKSYLFKVLEGIAKEDPNMIDIEEAEDLVSEGGEENEES
jgi:hypothetical protein